MIGPGNALSDPYLLTWINDAYLTIIDAITSANPEYFTKSATTSTAAGTREYTLPDDYEKVLKVEIKLDGTWYRGNPLDNIGTLTETSSGNSYGYSNSTVSYYVYGNKIGFQPIPGETTADNIKLWYLYTPAELSADGDVPAFSTKYHHLITLGAYANFLDSDEEHVAAENMRRRFDKRISDLVENLYQNQVDQPKSVQVGSNTDMYYNDEI